MTEMDHQISKSKIKDWSGCLQRDLNGASVSDPAMLNEKLFFSFSFISHPIKQYHQIREFPSKIQGLNPFSREQY